MPAALLFFALIAMPKNLPHPSEPKRPRPAASSPADASASSDAGASGPSSSPSSSSKKPLVEAGAGLAGLGGLRDALKGAAQRAQREKAAAAQASREAAADAELFRREIGEVAPLSAKPRASVTRTPPAPVPMQTKLDEEAVLHEAISDEFDPEVLLDTDESLSYCRPGVSQEIVKKLRRGAWIVQAQLDLHGMRREEAREALSEFIREASKKGLRCLRVIHGKGLGSVGKEPVLKGKVRAWLVQKEEVIAFSQARPHDGGAGAVLVLLQPGSVGSGAGSGTGTSSSSSSGKV
ncbi:DNA-nicking endonuclease, Smr domain [Paraburkholderia diazotrophica]|uniref:DNA-nicking endonuclease, Smr domain n=2 Tax=Paraburkholderia diazotrophica TaxID=667676 RepID=A0A1H7AA75_9BURK|nr:DNA-nicking endonuclease, Smr domain [Paraburkholderia diazotrophica]